VLLAIFAIITGAIASFLFIFILKRHIRKNGTVKEKSFIINVPKIFGTINIILAVVFGIWYIINHSAFSQNEQIGNMFVLVFLHIFFTYFHILALPLSIGSIVLTLFLKKYIKRIWFVYYILTNAIATTILFPLIYFILNK
jgi:hypothetical protein